MNVQEYRAYCTGLFEGEGSIGYYIGTDLRNGNQYRRIKLEISMTDEQPIDIFWETMGVGKFYVLDNLRSRKPVYRYQVQTYETVQYVVGILWEGLSPRRKQQCIDALSDYRNYGGMNRIPPKRRVKGGSH